MKKILMVIAPTNFRDVEYIVPRAFFEQSGCAITTTSTIHQSVGKFGFKVKNDILIQDVNPENYHGVYFVGGTGSLIYNDNPHAEAIAKYVLKSRKALGAICAAPRNFLVWGIMKDKKITGHNWDGNFESISQSAGATPFVDESVVIDGKVLTANGPNAAELSAMKFLELLEK